ncbi:MAG: disulfide bond formation protein B [Janthinobacterium lividum]
MRLFEAWRAALIGTLVSAAALAAAFATEWGLGIVPCALCLVERWPYRIGIALGLLALVWARGRRVVLALMAVTMLAGAGAGAVHVGVEQGWWPSPLPECAAPDLGHGTAAERLARMPLFPAKPCDDPTYLIPGLPVSMAMANLLLALALAIYLAISAAGPRKPA